MRAALTLCLLFLLLGCVQPGTPIRQHRTRGLPSGFPPDFPLHIRFSVQEQGKKLQWDEGDYFILKLVTDLKLRDIHYFFRKELATDRNYQMLRESVTESGLGLLIFEKGPRSVEITLGKEEGKNTIFIRLKEKKHGRGK